MFLVLSYFGTDQSQVQRYISGASLRESRLGLMFNAVCKIPMQFFILLLGVLLFVFYQFEQPPVFFNQAAWQPALRRDAARASCGPSKHEFAAAFAAETASDSCAGSTRGMPATRRPRRRPHQAAARRARSRARPSRERSQARDANRGRRPTTPITSSSRSSSSNCRTG